MKARNPNPQSVSTYKEAFEIGSKALKITQSKAYTELPSQKPPWHIYTEGPIPWEMSVNALSNTLNYVMNHLHHPCYLYVVDGSKKRRLYKLETQQTAPIVQSALESIQTNGAEAEKAKSRILEDIRSKKKAYRIMQCIVKPFSNNFSTEYESWCQKWPLPPGLYILNLTDAILLRKDFHEPFPNAFVGNKHPELPAELRQSPFLPILSLSGHVDYWDIPIPTYDDLEYTLPLTDGNQTRRQDVAHFTTEWHLKTNAKPVFRGSTTGCGITAETNQRIHLVEKYGKNKKYDVGFSNVEKGKNKLDPIQGFVMANPSAQWTTKGRLSMAEQSRHKMLIHIDGNVLAYRLLYSMLTGSLILRVKSPYQSFVDVAGLLKPGVHYIEIKPDLSNLEAEVARWMEKDEEASQVAYTGMMAAREILTDRFLQLYFQNIFQFYKKHQVRLGGGLGRHSRRRCRKRTPKRSIATRRAKPAIKL